ncbi:MAG TPA: PTS fructose transporter subunit IIC [Lachnospiraceae bacterium]|nr:PTS fructose transporter subunit IIC [Lachnospiraceae bacterium]
MKIVDLLRRDSICLNGKASGKMDVIDYMVSLMEKGGHLSDVKAYKQAVLKREAEGTTGIGEGVAIPHAKTDAVLSPGLAAMTFSEGVEFDSLDGQPVRLVFMIGAPDTKDNVHLEVLSRLSMLLMDQRFREHLLHAKSPEAFLKVIDVAEKEKFAKEDKISEGAPAAAQGQALSDQKMSGYQILAVTACPTGIAHTYMAQEALEQQARKMGYRIKVETNGSGGVKNALTRDDIAAADCIIIAADKNVEMARFEGKPVIQTRVSDGIHKPGELIERAMGGQVPVYHHQNQNGDREEGRDGVGHGIYKHLMNGVSHMLPFVIGGGILIALAFLLDDYQIDPANFGMNTPAAAFFKTIGGQAFGFMLPILSGYIAMSIADRPGLVVGFVGGAVANAGYTFGNMMHYGEAVPISSGFLGALLAGFLAGYIVLGLQKLCAGLPKSLEGMKPMLIYPVAGIGIMGFVMVLINPIVGAINTGMNQALASMGGTSKVLLGAVLGGMMSIDMGGPFNKAAYVFGTASLASDGFDIMAAVMAGGMVPPIAVALCATVFKNRFTKKDRQSAYVNYIMGLSFISEGAIPYAAADPLRVIPSCVIGSAVTGALSMIFGCGLRAPHGGIFVIPTVLHPFQYILAIAAGSVVGGLLMGILKKPVSEN